MLVLLFCFDMTTCYMVFCMYLATMVMMVISAVMPAFYWLVDVWHKIHHLGMRGGIERIVIIDAGPVVKRQLGF